MTMDDCCANAGCEIERLRARQSRTLVIILSINASMFLVEITAGLLAGSTALLADSLDMLGDALVYGFSLWVVGRSARWKAISALVKGGVMALFGIFVLAQAAYKVLHPEVPAVVTIGAVGALALAANGACLGLLWRHRGDDVNMRSVYLCSRNDIIANVAVLGAALGVWIWRSQWPDVVVGLAIAVLFLRTAFHVIRAGREVYMGSPEAARDP